MHCALHYTLCTTLHYTTLYYTLLPTEINHACDRGDVQTSIHYTTLHYTTLHSTLHYTMDYSLPKLITLVTVGMSKPLYTTLYTTQHYTTLYTALYYGLLPTEINHACDRGDVQTSAGYVSSNQHAYEL
jgi:hypothetical protein